MSKNTSIVVAKQMRARLKILLILLSMPISALADGGPYAMMGCDTPVLDYVEPDTPSIVLSDVRLRDGQSARLTLNVDKNEIAVATESSDTVALIKVDDESILRFMTMDPHAESYQYASPYAYCMGDPINFIDPTGLEPTEEEAARMAAYVYGDIDVKLSGGWTVIHDDLFEVEKKSGLKTVLFKREIGKGKFEYVLAFAGTQDAKDFKEDVRQLSGSSTQYSEAMEMAKDLYENYEGEITFVGHSLGGGLSAACAYVTSGRAITFNPAGVSIYTCPVNFKARIDAYITITDPLNIFSLISSLTGSPSRLFHMPIPDGIPHYVLPNTLSLNPVDHHSITNFTGASLMEKAFDLYVRFQDGVINYFYSVLP